MALSRLADPGYQKWTGPRDLLVGAALDVQQRVLDVIRQDFSDAHFLLEEPETLRQGTDAERARGDDRTDPLWIVEPLDGTVNFFVGFPVFAVSVGYRAEGIYRIGVVYDPSRDELFQATVGGGAFLNGQRIGVSQIADTAEALRSALVGTDWAGSDHQVKKAFQVSRFVAGQVLQVRMLGSPALGLSYVASGRLHAYYGLGHLSLWDIAAPAVILQEAGGSVTDIDGEDWVYGGEGCLGTNGGIHRRLWALISSVRKLQGLDREGAPRYEM
jgi:myo-inositol-1(or 4)-monophosphatase